MDPKYFPIEIEEKWSKIWAQRSLDRPKAKNRFSQIIPPPNVTGTLHMGHISFSMPSWTFIPDIII